MKIYPWGEPQTVWFLLTGISPHVNPLSIRSRTVANNLFERACLTIEVEPWVSAEAVKRAYVDVQRKVLGHRPEKRLPPERSLAVYNFCNRMEILADREFAWREKWEAWEKTHPKWRYLDWRALRTAYERAKRLATSRSVRRGAPVETTL